MTALASWSVDTDDNLSIEVRVLRFMRQWRLSGNRSLMSPSAKTSTALALTHTDADKSLYDSLCVSDNEEDTAMMDTTPDAEKDEDDTMEKKNAIDDYERRWRTLLVEISKQEESNEANAMFLPAKTSDEIMIIRPTCITSVPNKPAVTTQDERLIFAPL